MIPLAGDIKNSEGIIDENIDSWEITRGTSTLKRGFAHTVSYTHLTLPTILLV